MIINIPFQAQVMVREICLDLLAQLCKFLSHFSGILWKGVLVISKLHLICEEEGRIAHERQKSAVLFVSERSCY